MKKNHRPRISAIVAMAENRVIGKNNQLPWRLPADLKHFKKLTIDHPILMGRKTYESIGKPLPQRENIILTREPTFQAPGCLVVTSIEEALQSAKLETSKEFFIIGGAEIYRQLLPMLDRIYLTLVHHTFEGDVFFPELDANRWQESERVRHEADENNLYPYSFLILDKITRI